MPTKKKLGSTKAPKLDCHLEVVVNDLVYKGDAETLDQCLKDFVSSPNFPFAIKTRAVINYTEGNKSGRVIWPTVKARRQFNLISLKPYWSELVAERFTNNLS